MFISPFNLKAKLVFRETMPEKPESWLAKAEGNLRRAKDAYDDEEFWDAVSQLQQAEEKIAKALLLVMGIIPDSDKLREAFVSVLGIQNTGPEHLGHNWHANLMVELTPFLDSFEKVTKSLEKGKSDSSRTAAGWWAKTIPDYRDSLEKAKKVRSIPLPDLKEMDAVIKDCNLALETAANLSSTLNLPAPNPPDAKDIALSLNETLKSFGVKVDKESKKKAESIASARIPVFMSGFNAMFLEVAQQAYLLIVLMILNVYLQKHHTLANYPTSKVVYDKNFPMIVRFVELHGLLQRCFDLTKALL